MRDSRSDDYSEPLDRRQMTDEEEMIDVLAKADRKVLARVRAGVSTHTDYVYLVGRLNYNLNELEK